MTTTMKCLTICQPYAELIARGDKLVENRTWPTSHRGPLLIHAGKSRKWLSGDNYGIAIDSMVFGAIIGVCELRDCLAVYAGPDTLRFDDAAVVRRHPWLTQHRHVEGPWCWVLQECRRFETPIPYRGAQGLFNVPMEVVSEAIDAFRRLEAAQ